MRTAPPLFILCIALAPAACGKDDGGGGVPAAPTGVTAAPTAGGVQWDDPNKQSELDWPMQGADAMPVAGASSFARGAAEGQGSQAIWKRLSSYGGSFLRQWKSALQADGAAEPADIVDAFNELAVAVTGPAGFWRKTVPKSWLGCGELAESAPCKKMAELDKELAQWDEVQKQIESLEPERSARFLARNEARILLYLDTYVPDEPSAEAMRTTKFYRKHLASVLDAWAGDDGGASNRDL